MDRKTEEIQDIQSDSERPVFIISKNDGVIGHTAKRTSVTSSTPETPAQSTRNWILAFIMLISFVVLNTTSSQLSNLAFTDDTLNFKARYLFILFKVLFRSLAFPIYITINTIVKLLRGRKLNFSRTFRRCVAICGSEGLTFRVIMTKFFPPMFFNLLVQIGYTLGISNLHPSVASALTTPTVATSYIMSWLFLNHPLLAVKVFFVLVSFGGVALIAYEKFVFEFSTAMVIGVCGMIGQDLSTSVYQLFFKKAFPKGDLGQVSFAVSGMYLLMTIVYWPVPLILKLTGMETYSMKDLPYHILVGDWSCTAVSSMVYGYGIVLSNGFFMSLTDLLVLAANTCIDALRHVVISQSQLIGTIVVGAAFIMMVLPDRFLSINFKRFIRKSGINLDIPLNESESQPDAVPEMHSRTSIENPVIIYSASDADLLEDQPVASDDGTITAL